MNKDIAIKVENISKTFRIPHEKISSLRGAAVNLFRTGGYEEFKALDDVSFEVKKGEFFGIVGRNGSGKSTLLKILAGIYQVDRGKVKINGMISPFLELGIGFNPELSGRDNIYLNATVLGLSQKEVREKFDTIVAFSELERFIDQKLKNYSSGMKVRLAFSVSIHANREILLMDEVLAVGDNNFKSKCMEEFNKHKAAGKTVILVSHSTSTIEQHCDRAMLLRNGKIEIIGDAKKVVDEYICQNMSDEERRTQEEKKSKNNVKSNGIKEKELDLEKIVEITNIEFLNANSQPKNIFEAGDDMSIKVYFKKKKEAPALNFSIAIHNIEDIYISEINTITDKINTEKHSACGYFQINFKKIPLQTNSYYLKIEISGKDDEKIYAFLEKSDIFKIVSSNQNDGIIKLDYEWD